MNPRCPGCGCPLNVWAEAGTMPTSPDKHYAECRNAACALHWVKLPLGAHAHLSRAAIHTYAEAKQRKAYNHV